MVNYIYQSGKPVYGLHHYVVDTATEITKLPVNCAIGSIATVIATGEDYIINSQKKWIKQPVKGSSSGSGDGSGVIPEPSEDYHEIVVLDNNSLSTTSNNEIVVLGEV